MGGGKPNAASQNPLQQAFAQKHELNIVSTLGRLQQASDDPIDLPADRLNRLLTYRHQMYQGHYLNTIISKTAAASNNRANMCYIWPNGPNSLLKLPKIVNRSLHQPYCRIWSNPTLRITKFTWDAVNPMPLRTVLYSQLLPKNTSLTWRVQCFDIQPIGVHPIDVATGALLICIKTHLGRLRLHAAVIPPIVHTAKQAQSIVTTVAYSKRGAEIQYHKHFRKWYFKTSHLPHITSINSQQLLHTPSKTAMLQQLRSLSHG